MIEIGSAGTTAIFTAFGQVGISAEMVAGSVAREAREYLVSNAAACEHLTDQLLLPMALAGGGWFTAVRVNLHARTNMDVIARFLPVRFDTPVPDGFTQTQSGIPSMPKQPQRSNLSVWRLYWTRLICRRL